MTPEEAIARLKELHECGDPEWAHSEADDVLCDLLISLGHDKVVEAWSAVEKWYA